MNLPITFAAIALLTAGVFSPVTAQAAPESLHRHLVRHHDDNDRRHDSSRRYRHYRTVRVYVRGHFVWHHGYRHWVPGHYEYRQVVYWR
ncbi:MAG TPA: hypothetical protein VK961_24255 [Chthoniobacter sp.]|nr:hypothetical protein [Chthoniobacter sp.]